LFVEQLALVAPMVKLRSFQTLEKLDKIAEEFIRDNGGVTKFLKLQMGSQIP